MDSRLVGYFAQIRLLTPGLSPTVYANGDTGLMPSAARSFRVPTQRVGTREG